MSDSVKMRKVAASDVKQNILKMFITVSKFNYFIGILFILHICNKLLTQNFKKIMKLIFFYYMYENYGIKVRTIDNKVARSSTLISLARTTNLPESSRFHWDNLFTLVIVCQ